MRRRLSAAIQRPRSAVAPRLLGRCRVYGQQCLETRPPVVERAMPRGGWCSRCLMLGLVGAVVLLGVGWWLIGAEVAHGDAAASQPLSCGHRPLFAQRFQVRVRGDYDKFGLDCRLARELTREKCRIRFGRVWSCFSFRSPWPFQVWWPSDETWEAQYSTVVELRRYPCPRARLSARRFRRPSREFPTRRQLLADDVIRCELLRGKRRRRVRRLLGRPDFSSGKLTSYYLGDQRDSYFQIDPEHLYLSYSRGGRVRSASIGPG